MKTLNINELQILGATIPSAKEIENLTKEQRRYRYWYWLRSPYNVMRGASHVYLGGFIYRYSAPAYFYGHVRPALVVDNLQSFNPEVGEEVRIEDFPDSEFSKYIVVNEHMLLANFDIGEYTFNEDIDKGTDYWTSDIRQVVDKWFEVNFEDYLEKD